MKTIYFLLKLLEHVLFKIFITNGDHPTRQPG